MKTNRIAIISAIVCALLSIVMILSFILTRDRGLAEGYKDISEYGGEFTLQGKEGAVSLSDLKGKVVVIYFGFMNCQEACPVSMTKMRDAFKRLSEEELKNVQGIFVSIDPKRDTPEELDIFAKRYHKNVIALVDTEQVIREVVDQYGAIADMDILDGNSVTYTVDHSSRFYMIDKQGVLVTTLSHSTTIAELTAKIRQMLNE